MSLDEQKEKLAIIKRRLDMLEDEGEYIPQVDLEQVAGDDPEFKELLRAQKLHIMQGLVYGPSRDDGNHDDGLKEIKLEMMKAERAHQQKMEEMTLAHQQMMEADASARQKVFDDFDLEMKRRQLAQPELTAPPPADDRISKLEKDLQEEREARLNAERDAEIAVVEAERDKWKEKAEARSEPSEEEVPSDIVLLMSKMDDLKDEMRSKLSGHTPSEADFKPGGLFEELERMADLNERADERLDKLGLQRKGSGLEQLGDFSDDPIIRYGRAITDMVGNMLERPRVQALLLKLFPEEDLSELDARRRAQEASGPEPKELREAKQWCRERGFIPKKVMNIDDDTIQKLLAGNHLPPQWVPRLKECREIFQRYGKKEEPEPEPETIDAEFEVVKDEGEGPMDPDSDDDGYEAAGAGGDLAGGSAMEAMGEVDDLIEAEREKLRAQAEAQAADVLDDDEPEPPPKKKPRKSSKTSKKKSQKKKGKKKSSKKRKQDDDDEEAAPVATTP